MAKIVKNCFATLKTLFSADQPYRTKCVLFVSCLYFTQVCQFITFFISPPQDFIINYCINVNESPKNIELFWRFLIVTAVWGSIDPKYWPVQSRVVFRPYEPPLSYRSDIIHTPINVFLNIKSDSYYHCYHSKSMKLFHRKLVDFCL